MKEKIRDNVKRAIMNLQRAEKWLKFDLPEIEISYPKEEKFGDYSTNIAMILAPVLKRKPIEIANQIIPNFQFPISNYFEKVEAVAPGYINFYLSRKYI